MATKRKVSKVTNRSRNTSKQEGFLSQIKWGESYTSLFLGAVVVVVALVLVFSFIKSKNVNIIKTANAPTSTNLTEEKNSNLGKMTIGKTYTVKAGDDLWHIAEKVYGSGYNWVDIANANKLENPGLLYSGTKLIIPNVKEKIVTTQVVNPVEKQNPISGVTYTVVKGDDLWAIAERSYGDGYKWVQIAKANNLINPNVIHPGNILKLPR